MRNDMTKEGICHLCGLHKKLSFEHIPPKSAFNDQMVVFQTMQNMLEGRKKTKFHRGMGKDTLCEDCNKLTGAWYGKAFVDWSRQGFTWFDRVQNTEIPYLTFHIKPLNVLKQVFIMSMAMIADESLSYHKELVAFLLDRHSTTLPTKYRAYVYFSAAGSPRFATGMAIMRTDINSIDYVDAEVSRPPFGYCVTSSTKREKKSLAESQGLCNITGFANYDFNEKTTIHLHIPFRETHEPLPLDYRSAEEVKKHQERTK